MTYAGTARQFALSLPESCEADHHGSPSFRVRGKIFAELSEDETEAIVKLPQPVQFALVASDPETFVIEPHWGRCGWTRMQLSGTAPETLKDLIAQSWRLVAPRNWLPRGK